MTALAIYKESRNLAGASGRQVCRSMTRAGKLKPFKVMSPPFEEDVLVDGFYPQMSMRIRCDRLHHAIYESVYNAGRQSGLVRDRNGVKKGAPACMALQLAGCRH